MIEPTQILIFTVVIILTILMVIIAWQIYLILSEIRKSLIKMNIIIDDAVSFTNNIGKSIENFSGFAAGVKAVLGIVNLFKKKEKEDGERKR